MKTCNAVNLLVVVGCVTLTSNVYAQASNAMPVPARIVWTRVCNSGGLFHGGCVTGFMG